MLVVQRAASFPHWVQHFPYKRHFSIVKSSWPQLSVPDVNFCDLLLSNAEKHSSKLAIVDARTNALRTNLSYGDLLSSRRSLASALIKHKVQPGENILVCMKNSPQFVQTLLGILAARCVVSSVNPNSTAAEVARQMESSRAERIFVDSDLFQQGILNFENNSQKLKQIVVVGETVPDSSRVIFNLDDLLNDNGSEYEGNLTSKAESWKDKIVFLPYSSGTTGLPKGVMLSHGNMTSNYYQCEAMFRGFWQSNDVLLGLLPMYHLYCLGVILPRSLIQGAQLVVMNKLDRETFMDDLIHYKMTTLHIVPPIVHFMNSSSSIKTLDLKAIKEVLIAAAPLDEYQENQLREQLSRHNPDVYIQQGYGLTETSPIITLNSSSGKKKRGSVGELAPNQEAQMVCPDTNKVCRSGEIGELWIRGPNIMLGYLNNPAATKDCLTEDGWLKTGDMGYYDEDGFFYIVDRLKELIKYNALQVAPAELEGVLRTHPQIEDCAVSGRPSKRSGELPTAFVVKRSANLTEGEVTKFVKERVADHKQLRGGVIFVNEIPKSPSGKILRRELKKMLTEVN